MSTITTTRVLPLPIHHYHDDDSESDNEETVVIAPPPKKRVIPPYLNRGNFIPFKEEDFGDGGAFPEIHVAQYPLDMGKPGSKSTAVISVDVDESGEIRYDAIVRQGVNKDKIVRTSLADMKEKDGDANKLALPQEDEEQEIADKTKMALEALLDGKIKKAKPTTIHSANEGEEPTYIRYTPNPNAPGYNDSAKQRVIRMVEAQVDPMEPPKHKFKKVPRGPPSPPVPVLHSPPRKLTVQDQQAWKIPPCISNWKNARGYTIPLDKRLAADGRGLQEVTINNKFASLSETLYIAERKAAEDLRIRNTLRKQMAMKEKEDKEKDLREMANKARQERAGVLAKGNAPSQEEPSYYQRTEPDRNEDLGNDRRARRDSGSESSGRRSRSSSSASSASSDDRGDERGRGDDHSDNELDNARHRERSKDRSRYDDNRRRSRSGDRGESRRDNYGRDQPQDMQMESEEDRQARYQREKLRIERRKERERELRLENMKGTMRKNKIDRDMNRDVSEKIALGMHRGSGQLSGEAMYDSRLFNQSSGMDAGFGAEDEYNTYSKPLFDRQEAGSIYRPKANDSDIYGDADVQMSKLSDTSKFKPDKGFKGAEGGGHAGGRDAPVQFEKAQKDPFGIDDIVESRKKPRNY